MPPPAEPCSAWCRTSLRCPKAGCAAALQRGLQRARRPVRPEPRSPRRVVRVQAAGRPPAASRRPAGRRTRLEPPPTPTGPADRRAAVPGDFGAPHRLRRRPTPGRRPCKGWTADARFDTDAAGTRLNLPKARPGPVAASRARRRSGTTAPRLHPPRRTRRALALRPRKLFRRCRDAAAGGPALQWAHQLRFALGPCGAGAGRPHYRCWPWRRLAIEPPRRSTTSWWSSGQSLPPRAIGTPQRRAAQTAPTIAAAAGRIAHRRTAIAPPSRKAVWPARTLGQGGWPPPAKLHAAKPRCPPAPRA